MELADVALLTRFRDGDDAAYNTIYNRCRRDVEKFAASIFQMYAPLLISHVPDVLQDVFLRLHTFRSRFDTAKDPLKWLRSVTYRTVLNVIKAESVKERNYRRTISMEHFITENNTVGDTLTAVEDRIVDNTDALLFGLNNLPEKQREILVLIYFQGYTHEEVAERFKTTVKDVKCVKYKSLRNMRRQLCQQSSTSAPKPVTC
jgi:RNA polymerase sigma-70 factor, ECF subfamily